MKLKVRRVKTVNPSSKKSGYAARVASNGVKSFADIVEDASKNTTVHKAEVTAASMLFVESIVTALKNGHIVDLGQLGKLYPSAKSKWHETAEEVTLAEVQPRVYYAPSAEIDGAIKAADLSWEKKNDSTDKNDEETADNGNTPTPPDDDQSF